jgi:DNA-directed RNA polymerase subunit L
MIPIHLTNKQIEEWNEDDFVFEINVTNKSDSHINITSKDIIVKDKNNNQINEFAKQMFPKNKITGEYIIITKLPPYNNNNNNSSLQTEETQFNAILKASKGTGAKSICYSTVSLCTFYNEIDDNKTKSELVKYIQNNKELSTEQAKLRYNTLEYQKAFKTNKFLEPSEFVFKLESECKLSFDVIFINALQILQNSIIELKEFNEDKIYIEVTDNDTFNVIVSQEDHTIGNLLQSLIYNEHIRELKKKHISFIGYNVPHPLDKRFVLKIKSSKSKIKKTPERDQIESDSTINEITLKDLLIKSFNNIESILTNIITEWKDFTQKL